MVERIGGGGGGGGGAIAYRPESVSVLGTVDVTQFAGVGEFRQPEPDPTDNSILYGVDPSNGVLVALDISDLANPSLADTASVASTSGSRAVTVTDAGDYLYHRNQGVEITSPGTFGTVTSDVGASDSNAMATVGNTLYISDSVEDISIYDISTRSSAAPVSFVSQGADDGNLITELAVSDGVLWIDGEDSAQHYTFSVDSPQSPVPMGAGVPSYSVAMQIQSVYGYDSAAGRLFYAGENAETLSVVDVTL